jgi:hypothetical protein
MEMWKLNFRVDRVDQKQNCIRGQSADRLTFYVGL